MSLYSVQRTELSHKTENAEPFLIRTQDLRRRLQRLLGPADPTSKRLNLRELARSIRYRLTGSALEQTLKIAKIFEQLDVARSVNGRRMSQFTECLEGRCGVGFSGDKLGEGVRRGQTGIQARCRGTAVCHVLAGDLALRAPSRGAEALCSRELENFRFAGIVEGMEKVDGSLQYPKQYSECDES